MAAHLRQFVVKTMKGSLLTGISAPMVQSVRFRKPRGLPIAKSKEFYVRQPTPTDPEEEAELKDRYTKYRAEVESIRQFIKHELSQEELNLTEKQDTDDASDLLWMSEQVKEWNKSVAVMRSERQAEEERQELERIQLLIQRRAEDRLQRAIAAEKVLHKNMAASENFITTDNLDEAIEKMLDTRSDYNFAITKTGEILPGEYPDRSGGTGPPTRKMDNPT